MSEPADIDANAYVHHLVSGSAPHADGTLAVFETPGVWVLAHRAPSTDGKLVLLVFPTKDRALAHAAQLAMLCELGQHRRLAGKGRRAFKHEKYGKVLRLYDRATPRWALLRVEPAFLTDP